MLCIWGHFTLYQHVLFQCGVFVNTLILNELKFELPYQEREQVHLFISGNLDECKI